MKRLFSPDGDIETTLFRLGWMFLLLLALLVIVSLISPGIRRLLFTPCYFQLLTGLYCPGCGGSRAVNHLLHGRLLQSLIFHPFLIYGGGLFTLFMASHTASRLTGGRIRGMKYRNYYLYLGLVIVILNWVVKNALLLGWGIDLLNL